MTIDEYEREALTDLNFDVTQFQEYSKSLGTKRIKWSRYLFNEESIFTLAEDKLKELYKDKLYYLLYKAPEKIDKKYIEAFIKGDPEYRLAEQAVAKQNSKVKFVNEILNTIDRQSFQCSNILKHMMWQSGTNA